MKGKVHRALQYLPVIVYSAAVIDSSNSQVCKIICLLPVSPALMVDYIPLPCGIVVYHDGAHEKGYKWIPQQLKVEAI